MSWKAVFENPGRLQGREMELLSELSLEPIRRRVPGPGDSVVYDRSYNELLRRGLIKIHETQPAGWDGIKNESYSSGVLIKVSPDGEQYKIAYYWATRT